MQDKLKTQIQQAVKSIIEGTSSIYKNENLSGKGIVMCAGGKNLFSSALITIQLLRQTGCTLPIQWYYADAQEMPASALKYLEENYQITCINLDEIEAFKGLNKRGFQIKAMAISASSFEHVLFIDSDNLPIRDPSVIFDSLEYQNTGAVFWTDISRFAYGQAINTQNHISCCNMLGIEAPQHGEYEFESGQLLINKNQHRIPLQICLFMNLNYPIFYKILYGDKDTFRYAWKCAEASLHIVTPKPGIIGSYNPAKNHFKGYGLVQYNLEHFPLFIHMNIRTWFQKLDLPWNYWAANFEHAQLYPEAGTHGYYGITDEIINLAPVANKMKSTMEAGETLWNELNTSQQQLLQCFN